VAFRVSLRRKFVAEHKAVLEASSSEEWTDYCAKFRVSYIAGK
jgi:hypothetical protein